MSNLAAHSAVPGAAAPDEPIVVGYVMTHYPRVALTFIEREIDEVARQGIDVRTVAMNLPGDADMLAPGAAEKRSQTTYLKASWLRTGLAFLGEALRSPLTMLRLVALAVSSSGGDAGLALRRCSHLCQAALLARTCRVQGIGQLHAHFGLAPATIAWFATEIARGQGRKAGFGFTIHGYHDLIDPKVARLDLKALAASYVVCISDYTRSQLCLLTDPALWDKFHVVRCGIDPALYAWREPPPRGARIRIMALGRLSPEKGFGILLRALRCLVDDGLPVELVLVGDGPERAGLELLCVTLGLEGNVRFAGERNPDDVIEELRAADIFCLPSFNEGLPVSIMEAMAIGVPVVTTWISGIPELAVDGETALTVAPARIDSLAEALARLARDADLGKRLSRSARAKVEELHDIGRNGAAMAVLLKEHRR